jgi:uncharacterized protein (DUF433 family)
MNSWERFFCFALEINQIKQRACLPAWLGIVCSSMNVELLKRITIEPGKCGGRPCIRGMRMRVTDVLQLLSAGASHQEILQDYPDLEPEDILAAIEYAAHQTDHVVLTGA